MLLGLGLGGFFDGIVLHQILQWHHMVSHTDRWPMTTLAGLEANTLADGLFHAATYIFTIAGVWLLWGVLRERDGRWSNRVFVGLLILGWGIFNVVEGTVDHHILRIHRVREDAAHPMLWDIGFLIWGASMVAIGWYLQRRQDVDTGGRKLIGARGRQRA
jgi:uncharacterized membrane protein